MTNSCEIGHNLSGGIRTRPKEWTRIWIFLTFLPISPLLSLTGSFSEASFAYTPAGKTSLPPGWGRGGVRTPGSHASHTLPVVFPSVLPTLRGPVGSQFQVILLAHLPRMRPLPSSQAQLPPRADLRPPLTATLTVTVLQLPLPLPPLLRWPLQALCPQRSPAVPQATNGPRPCSLPVAGRLVAALISQPLGPGTQGKLLPQQS